MPIAPIATNAALLTARAKQSLVGAEQGAQYGVLQVRRRSQEVFDLGQIPKCLEIDECAKDAHLQSKSVSRLNRPGGMSRLAIYDAPSAFNHDDHFGIELRHIISKLSHDEICIRAGEDALS